MKEYTVKQLFNIVDGRLSTTMNDVYDILNYLTGQQLMTHHLPIASRYVRSKAPNWYLQVAEDIQKARNEVGDKFQDLIQHPNMDKFYFIAPLDEWDMQGFEKYMINNSLLRKKLIDDESKN